MNTGKMISLAYFSQLYDRGISTKEMAEDLSTYTGNKITTADVKEIAKSYGFDLRKKKRPNQTTRAKKVKYVLEDVTTSNTTGDKEEAFYGASNVANVEGNN